MIKCSKGRKEVKICDVRSDVPRQTEQYFNNRKTGKIFHNLNCKSSNVIYLIDCTLCNNKPYIVKSETQSNVRTTAQIQRSRILSSRNGRISGLQTVTTRNSIFHSDETNDVNEMKSGHTNATRRSDPVRQLRDVRPTVFTFGSHQPLTSNHINDISKQQQLKNHIPDRRLGEEPKGLKFIQ